MITVDLWLYGSLSRFIKTSKTKSYAHSSEALPNGSTLGDLLARLSIPGDERGITFLNGELSAIPGVQPDLDCALADGDRVALFHVGRAWPFQYRHGAVMSPELAEATAEGRLFHNTNPTAD